MIHIHDNANSMLLSVEDVKLGLTLLHSERQKIYGVLAILSAIGLNNSLFIEFQVQTTEKAD